MTLKPEELARVQETMLTVFKEIAPTLAIWLFNHPDAKNYLRMSFKGDDGRDFDIIVQKPTDRHASCPLCHGTNPVAERLIESEQVLP